VSASHNFLAAMQQMPDNRRPNSWRLNKNKVRDD
jgi:hypothetical protein